MMTIKKHRTRFSWCRHAHVTSWHIHVNLTLAPVRTFSHTQTPTTAPEEQRKKPKSIAGQLPEKIDTTKHFTFLRLSRFISGLSSSPFDSSVSLPCQMRTRMLSADNKAAGTTWSIPSVIFLPPPRTKITPPCVSGLFMFLSRHISFPDL